MVLIEAYSSRTGGSTASSLAGQHLVSSSDDVLVILAHEANGVSADTLVLQINGITQIVTTNSAGGTGSTDHVKFYYVRNPPVGILQLSLTTSDGPSSWGYFAYTISGANKAQAIPRTQVATFSAVNPFLASLTVPMANGLIIEGITSESEAPVFPTRPEQVQSGSADDGANSSGIGNAIIYPSRTTQPVEWHNTPNATFTGAYLAVFIESDFMPSIWNPADSFKDRYALIRGNALDNRANRTSVNVSVPPPTPYLSSFLHTIGRLGGGSASPPTLVAETELQTSQIVVDRITQQAAASATSLTSDHLVSSQDAVMLIFASQMGVAQGLNSVSLNGVPLNALGNPSISTLSAGGYFIINPNVGVNVISSSVTLPTALELIVITLLGVDKKTVNPVFVPNSGATGSPSTVITPASANALLIDFVSSLGTSIAEDPSQTVYFDQPQTASQAAGSIKLSTLGAQTMSWTTLTSAWIQLVIALEPANAPSMWFPNIDSRNLSDVIAVNALDDFANPTGNFYQTYGDYPTQLWQNSFLHTVGRLRPSSVVNTSVTQLAANLTMSGGTQGVAGQQDISISQSGAVLTMSGGTQTIAAKVSTSAAQSAANLTMSGGVQAVATVQDVAIAQSHATLTMSGGTQTVANSQFVSLNQSAAVLTMSGGTQAVFAGAITNVTVSQAAAQLIMTGGVQSIVAITPPHYIPLTLTLQAQLLVVTLSGAVSILTLTDNEQLRIALTASDLSATISARPLDVTLRAPSYALTLKG